MNIRRYYERLEAERDRVRFRLELAEQTEWNWPSTRARVEVWRLQDELNDLEKQLFVRAHDEEKVALTAR